MHGDILWWLLSSLFYCFKAQALHDGGGLGFVLNMLEIEQPQIHSVSKYFTQ